MFECYECSYWPDKFRILCQHLVYFIVNLWYIHFAFGKFGSSCFQLLNDLFVGIRKWNTRNLNSFFFVSLVIQFILSYVLRVLHFICSFNNSFFEYCFGGFHLFFNLLSEIIVKRSVLKFELLMMCFHMPFVLQPFIPSFMRNCDFNCKIGSCNSLYVPKLFVQCCTGFIVIANRLPNQTRHYTKKSYLKRQVLIVLFSFRRFVASVLSIHFDILPVFENALSSISFIWWLFNILRKIKLALLLIFTIRVPIINDLGLVVELLSAVIN